MSDKPVIFISHAVEDKEMAIKLKKDWERGWTEKDKFFSQIDVFVSSDPTAISVGQDWFSAVVSKLQRANILVVLLTKSSLNRPWVWFEIGFFWNRKNSGERVEIFPLYESDVQVPSPLNVLQAKCLSNPEEMMMFHASVAGKIAGLLMRDIKWSG